MKVGSVIYRKCRDCGLLRNLAEAKDCPACKHRKFKMESKKMSGAQIASLKKRLMANWQALVPREQEVLSMRFGFDDGVARTLEEVAGKFGLTRERIRQIQAVALLKCEQAKGSERI